jgi:anaerobic magnesium-protoporphyrin IX monomethyl ester cyclase
VSIDTPQTASQYDALIISPHVLYDADGFPVRSGSQDLSFIVPLGVLSIAQHLDSRGLRVKLLHLESVYQSDPDGWDLDRIFAAHPALVVGIQAHWYLYAESALVVAERYRRLHPDSRIFLGGQFASVLAEQFLAASRSIDGIVNGEGEIPMERLVLAAKARRELSDVGGCWHRKGNDLVVRQPDADGVVPMDELPLLDPRREVFRGVQWSDRTYMNISRGLCPRPCGYCMASNPSYFRRNLSSVSVRRVVEQARIFDECGFKDVHLGENEFLMPEFMEELAEALQGAGLRLTLRLETHPALFENGAVARKLVRGGFRRFVLGAESGSLKVLRRAGRWSTPEELLRAVRHVHDAGATVLTAWISNLPGEEEEDIQASLKTMTDVVDAGGDVYWISSLVCPPATPFALAPERYGLRLIVRTLEDWRRWSRVSKESVTLEGLLAQPLKYLTQVSEGVEPEEMVRRLCRYRDHARRLVPKMRKNAEVIRDNEELYRGHHQMLDWYEREGYRLHTF